MKKQLFFCLLFIAAITVKAQVWSPPGATWTYSYTNNFAIMGYVEIKYVGDSMVAGQLTKVLEKMRYILDQSSLVSDTINLGKEYTYLDSNIVYYYRLGQFYPLYDFNAQVNDQWTVAGESGTGCDSTGKVQVDNVSTLIFNSDTLISQMISSPDASDWQLGSSLVERIGCIDGYMFPELTTCIADANQGGPFRCYWDDSFPVYSSGITTTCDFITSIEQISNDSHWNVYPNPTTGWITLTELSNAATGITIYNVLGELVHTQGLSGSNNLVMDLGGLPGGMYYLQVFHEETTLIRKIIKM